MHQPDYSQQSYGGQYYDNRPPMNEPHYGGHDNPAKKQRRTNVVAALEKHQQDISGQDPSRVVHARNLPLDLHDEELLLLCAQFGTVPSILFIKQKTQAFIQMDEKNDAVHLVNFYAFNPPTIRGRTIYFQFSSRDEISLNAEDEKYDDIPNAILNVHIINLQFPVTIDTLASIFSKYGSVIKIIVYAQLPTVSLDFFIQFSSVQEATSAKQGLNCQNIYSNCCNLQIRFSVLRDLHIKFNNDRMRDFTNPMLPKTMGELKPTPDQYSAPQPDYYNPPPPQQQQHPHPPPHHGGNYPPPRGEWSQPPPPPQQHHPPHRDNYRDSPYAGGCVLLVDNLVPEVSLDDIFTLFGVYGDVVRVKILYSKQETALVQFATPQQSTTALENLNGAPLLGRNLHVSYSKHKEVVLPRIGDSEARFTKDYTGSALHRFRMPDSKNYKHICRPSTTLHVSNITPNTPQHELIGLFQRYGAVVGFQYLSNTNKRMGLVQMGSLDQAITALIRIHNYRLGELNLRVSFTNNAISANQID